MNSLGVSLVLIPLFLGAGNWAPSTPKNSTISPLDEIENYRIDVTPNEDATLELVYTFTWKVLDSASEGPMSWVKIGVPNRFVDDIKALTGNIKSLNYSSEDGAYIEVYFTQEYYRGSLLDFSFSFHQERIFTLTADQQVTYRFNPGWFNEIEVKSLTVSWLKEGATYTNATATSDDGKYYLWQQSLGFGQSIDVDVAYPEAYFPAKDLAKQYSSETATWWETYGPLFFIGGGVLLIVLIAVLVRHYQGDGYYANRGFYGPYYQHYWFFSHHHSRNGGEVNPPPSILNSGHGGGHSSGGGCACACACACAGGGRAGCSRKDFVSSGNYEALREKLGEAKTKAK